MQTAPIQARRPPFNAQMMAGALKVASAIEALTQNNFTVVSVELNTPTRPTINIQTCGNCRRMVEKRRGRVLQLWPGYLLWPVPPGAV